MTVLWFLQRLEHSLGKPAVFVSLASCYVVVYSFFFFLSAYLILVLSLSHASLTLRTFSLSRRANVLPYLSAVVLPFGQTEAPSRYRFPARC